MARDPFAELNPQLDRELILANRARIHAELPEAVPFIKALVDAGLLAGWRSVTWVGTMDEPVLGIDPARWCRPVLYTAEENARFATLRSKL